MSGKQVRIAIKLYEWLSEIAAKQKITIGKCIEILIQEWKQCQELLTRYGIDPELDQKVIVLSEEAWKKLNLARAYHIIKVPEGTGEIDEVIISLIDRKR